MADIKLEANIDSEEPQVTPKPLERPKVTAAQIVLLTGAILQVIVSFGVHLSQQQQDSIQNLVTAAIAVVGADAIIRVARNFSNR